MVTRGAAMNLDANLSTAEQVAILDEVIQALNDGAWHTGANAQLAGLSPRLDLTAMARAGSHEDLQKHAAELRALQKHKAEDALHRKKERLHEAKMVFEADQKQAHAEFQVSPHSRRPPPAPAMLQPPLNRHAARETRPLRRYAGGAQD